MPRFLRGLILAVPVSFLVGRFLFAAPTNTSAVLDYACTGQSLATYMNTVISGAGSLPNIRLLSPVFNITSYTFIPIINAMVTANANFAGLDGIAANAYNLDGQRISDWVQSARASSAFASKPLYLTEIGMIEIDRNGTSRTTALNNLREEIAKIKAHQLNMQTGLLFDSFNSNPDPNFQYNVMTDEEINYVCSPVGSCSLGSCPSNNCQSIGINSAAYFSQGPGFYDRAQGHAMRFTMEIANNDSNPNLPSVWPGIVAALDRNMTPIIRIGVGNDSGGFTDPDDYVAFLQNLNTLLANKPGNKTVYAIAGPNEPDGEYWALASCGLPTPMPYQDPEGEGFDPLKYPCGTTVPNPLDPTKEFHPLRPYPGSPCDPLIPRKNPEAKDDPAKLYLSFACGKSLNAQGTYKFRQWFTQAEFNLLPIFPGDPSQAVPGTLYRCDATTTDQICVTKRSKFDVTIDLTAATLPVLGNTQDPLDYNTKVNNYLSWYLNGTVQHSDQEFIDPNNRTDIDNLVNYSGPVKKLLPQDLNNAVKEALKNGPERGNEYHDYIVSEPVRLSWAWSSLFPNIPYSSQEDTTGEITVSLVTQAICPNDGYSSANSCSQPTGVWQYNPNGLTDPQSMRLVMKPIDESDTRLYYPHARNLNALSDILASVHRPQPSSLNPASVVSQKVPDGQHQGDDGTLVQTDYEYPLDPFTQTRNTEIGPIGQAPRPLFGGDPGSGYDQICTLSDAKSNPGDDLMGESASATLTYTQRFQYPRQLVPTPAPGCIGEGSECAPYPAGAPPYGPCCDASRGVTCQEQGEGAPEPWRFSYRCVGGTPREDIELTTSGRVAVYTKTPFADRLYSTLVTSKDSVLHRFIPGPSPTPTTVPGNPDPAYLPCNAEYLKGENCPAQTVPAKTSVAYRAEAGDLTGEPSTVTTPANPSATAGDQTSGAEIYFPRLGSLFDYFLGAGNENLNLQKLLRPKDLATYVAPPPGPGGGGTPPPGGNAPTACLPYLGNFPGTITVGSDRNRTHFSKVGDSMTVANTYLHPFGGSNYDLGTFTELAAAVSHFSSNSFTRTSLAARNGWKTGDVLSTVGTCQPGVKSFLQCELDAFTPGVVLVQLGTNDASVYGTGATALQDFTTRLTTIVNTIDASGGIPILVTIPNYGSDAHLPYNSAISSVGASRGAPVIDLNAGLSGLPNFGRSGDNIHLLPHYSTPALLTTDELTRYGETVHNFLSLCGLNRILPSVQ